MKYAVIIKHPFRDQDYRVDIVEAPEGSEGEVKLQVQREMLGPFQVIAVVGEKLNMNRQLSLPDLQQEKHSQ